jgi:hypothetical protein
MPRVVVAGIWLLTAAGLASAAEIPGRWDAVLLSFITRYSVPFPILVSGTTDEAPAKLSQLTNFSVFPTTIVLGRDGRVRSVHAGFASAATGEAHAQLTREQRMLVVRLLAEPAPAAAPTASR